MAWQENLDVAAEILRFFQVEDIADTIEWAKGEIAQKDLLIQELRAENQRLSWFERRVDL